MTDSVKNNLIEIQKKIQNLKANSGNSGILQQLLEEACKLLVPSDKEAGAKVLGYAKELKYYTRGGEDNLERFYKCKAESLAIIAKKISQ